ncbi:hypothetical protein DPMN_184961 [Dreissena polymorpha]|uniref:Uncharacterized protein n=1 Tax=Dreissena polymorpha TaxID=45954 RepID=A0A9D4DK75_DREPO|nr:hypothetical protein DPMN_184961 [Dreissena polymorpha]
MAPRPGYTVYEFMIEMIHRNINDNSDETYINTSISQHITQMTLNTISLCCSPSLTQDDNPSTGSPRPRSRHPEIREKKQTADNKYSYKKIK